MGTVKILLLTVLPAVVLGCIAGVALGKYQLKKARRQLRALLNPKQRVAYSASIAIGVVCVMLGVFLPAPVSSGMEFGDNDIYADTGDMAAFEDINVFPEFNGEEEIQLDSEADGELDSQTDSAADDEANGNVNLEESAETGEAIKKPVATVRPSAPTVNMRGNDVAVAIMR